MKKNIDKNGFIYIDITDGSEEKEKVISMMVHENKLGELHLEIVSYYGDIEPKLPKEQHGMVRKGGKLLNNMSINSICNDLLVPNLNCVFNITEITMSILGSNRNEQGIKVDLENSTLEEVIEKLI